ncbi:MAG: hypothetical protein WCF33_06070, partial [Pseudonocardiaceae bacterium]
QPGERGTDPAGRHLRLGVENDVRALLRQRVNDSECQAHLFPFHTPPTREKLFGPMQTNL